MDRSELSHIAHTHHPLAAPITAERAAALLTRMPLPEGGRVLDLGCGQGEWLLMLLALRPDLRAVGVDTSQVGLEAGRRRAQDSGVGDRITWQHSDAATWTSHGGFDAAFCIGATHAFGGLAETLEVLHGHVTAGGHALLGDGFWDGPPSAAAQASLEAGPDDLPDLAGLVAAAVSADWQPISGHVSSAEEWDDYEWAWTGSLTEWALRSTSAEDAVQARETAAEHRAAWLSGYRGQLGFVTLVLADSR